MRHWSASSNGFLQGKAPRLCLFGRAVFLCGRKDMEMQRTQRLCCIASLIGCNSCNIHVIHVTILLVKRRDSIIGFK